MAKEYKDPRYTGNRVQDRQEETSGYRRLAATVMRKAYADACGAKPISHKRTESISASDFARDAEANRRAAVRVTDEARRFLSTDSALLEMWCALAGVSRARVLEEGRKLLAAPYPRYLRPKR